MTPVERAPTPTAPTRTLPGDIEGAVAAAIAHDGATLGALLTSTDGPCFVDWPPGDVLRAPACPGGVAAGTLVPALVIDGCPDDVRFIDRAIRFGVTGFDTRMYLNHSIGVVKIDTGPVRYAALFGVEKVGWLGFDDGGRLIGAGGGGTCSTVGLKPRLSASAWLRGPNWRD
jgi:hypothetical protein